MPVLPACPRRDRFSGSWTPEESLSLFADLGGRSSRASLSQLWPKPMELSFSFQSEGGAKASPISKPIFPQRMGNNERIRTQETAEISTKEKCSSLTPIASKLLLSYWHLCTTVTV